MRFTFVKPSPPRSRQAGPWMGEIAPLRTVFTPDAAQGEAFDAETLAANTFWQRVAPDAAEARAARAE